MEYKECLNAREITQVYDNVDIKYKGENYTICVGDNFGRLKVVHLVQFLDGKTKRKGCICECDCGNYIGPSRLYMLLSGDLVSCGCYAREIHSEQLTKSNYKHGQCCRGERTKLYNLWAAMRARVVADGDNAKYYRDKGITVCDEWQDFENFRDWAIANGYKDGLSIDRLDNSKGYNPQNCRFIKLQEQNSNKTSNVIFERDGQRHTIAEWCRITGKSYTYVAYRLRSGRPL